LGRGQWEGGESILSKGGGGGALFIEGGEAILDGGGKSLIWREKRAYAARKGEGKGHGLSLSPKYSREEGSRALGGGREEY